MKKYITAVLILFVTLLCSCVSTKIYTQNNAKLMGYKIAFEKIKIKNDSLIKANEILEMQVDSLILVIDSLQVEIENNSL